MFLQGIKNKFYRKFSTSFAKSGMDKMVFQLLNHKSKGFYVDIGSHHPIKANNTFFFYIRGWSGICIDPNPDFIQLYKKIRPNDIFINKGIGTFSEKLVYYKLKEGFSERNSFSLDYIAGNNLVELVESTFDIEIVPLSKLLESQCKGNAFPIDFMSVDCEAFDFDVLKSNDWQKYRPRFLLVESHLSLIDDFNSPLSDFMNSVGYDLIGKVMQGIHVGNLLFSDKNENCYK